MYFQKLNLKVGQIAECNAGFPEQFSVVVKCIKDFNCKNDKDEEYVLNNSNEFIETIEGSILTSHLIGSGWKKVLK